MGYPTAYRNRSAIGKASAAGFQKPPSPWNVPRPIPANDNIPKPANDNIRRAVLRRAGLRIGVRAGLKFVPYLGAALTAWELWQLWKQLPSPGFGNRLNPDFTGYNLVYNCQGVVHYAVSVGHSSCAQSNLVVNPNLMTPRVNIAGRPSIVYGWAAIEPRPGVPGQFISDPAARWERAVVAGNPVLGYKRVPVPGTNPFAEPGTDLMPWVPPAVIPPGVYPVPEMEPKPPWVRDPTPETSGGYSPPVNVNEPVRDPDAPPFTPREPTPPKTKERKSRVRAAGAALLRANHTLSEARDLLDAAWNSLPKKYQREAGKKPTPQEKAATLYKHWDKVDLSDLFFELLWNHFSDKIVGRKYGELDKWGRDNGITWGPHGQPDSGTALGVVKKQLKARWDEGVDVFEGALTG